MHLNLKDFKFMDVFTYGKVTNSEVISFGCGFPPENAFNSLVASNKSLSDVVIRISFGDIPDNTGENLALERVLEMTGCFLSSPELQFLEIVDELDDK